MGLKNGSTEKGSDDRAESIGQLSADVFQIQTSDRMKELIDILLAHAEELSEDTVKAAELAKKIMIIIKRFLKMSIKNMSF